MHASKASLIVPGRLAVATICGLGCLCLIPAATSASLPAPAASEASTTPDVRTVRWRFTGQTSRPGCRVERVAQICSRFAPEPVDIAHINVLRREGFGTRLVSVTPSTPGCAIVRAELGRDHASNRLPGMRCFGDAADLEVEVVFTLRTDRAPASAGEQPSTGTR